MTIRFDGSFTYETTDLPCPSWCELHAGHEMCYVIGGVDRHHSRTIGDQRLEIQIACYEEAESVDGPVTSVERTMMVASGIEDRNLSSSEARRLAAALLNAADRLDRLDAMDWI